MISPKEEGLSIELSESEGKNLNYQVLRLYPSPYRHWT